MLLTPQQLADKYRLKQIANLLRSADGDERKELLEEQEALRDRIKK